MLQVMSQMKYWSHLSILFGLGLGLAGLFLGGLIGSLVAVAASGWVGYQLADFLANHGPTSDEADLRYQTLEDERRTALALAQLTQIINATLEPTQIFNLSLAHLGEVLPYDSATILLVNDNDLQLAAYHPPITLENVVGKNFSIEDNSILQEIVTTHQPKVMADVQNVADWRPFDREEIAPRPTRSWIGAPLVVHGECIGILTLETYTPDIYGEREGSIMETFAAHIATAVQNARLFDSLRHQALEVAVMADNLSEEKSKLDAIIHHIADGLVVTDAQGTIRLVNPAFEEMFSQPNTTLAGGGLTQIEELERLIGQALADRERISIIDFALSNGRILKASSAVIHEDMRTLGVVTVLRDITREREIDRMKSEFISTVSHELRTPLTSVLGFARHINKTFSRNIIPKIDVDDRKGQRAILHINEELDIIVNEGERLTRLINEVLDIAKMEAGKLEWQMADVSIDEVIRNALAATSGLGREKNLPVHFEIEPDIPLVYADKDRLIQVVTNLLSNAIKFTDLGEINLRTKQVYISTVNETTPIGPGDWLTVEVQDTGIGIAEEHLPYVFEKFKQVGDVLTDRPAGTGLGVPICKEIVEQHGGYIWVNSEVGVGSTFSFALPLRMETQVKPKPHQESSFLLPLLQPQLENEKAQLILVVDDEENIRNLLRHELSEAGYRITEARDGLEALDRAREEQPDLIILDVMMPGLNGFDVISVLKGDPATVHTPILILSIIENKEKGLRLGAEAYLTKPLNIDKLLRNIARLLNHTESNREQPQVLPPK